MQETRVVPTIDGVRQADERSSNAPTRGTVGSASEKREAQNAPKSVVGVLSVDNHHLRRAVHVPLPHPRARRPRQDAALRHDAAGADAVHGLTWWTSACAGATIRTWQQRRRSCRWRRDTKRWQLDTGSRRATRSRRPSTRPIPPRLSTVLPGRCGGCGMRAGRLFTASGRMRASAATASSLVLRAWRFGSRVSTRLPSVMTLLRRAGSLVLSASYTTLLQARSRVGSCSRVLNVHVTR
jgi:hypothetical protein